MLIGLVGFGLAIAYVAHNAEPILRKRVIATLEERFHSPVELDSLQTSVVKGLQVTGSGLRIRNFGEKIGTVARPGDAPPMLTVKTFEFRTGLRALLRPTTHVSLVRVQGLELHIPPRQERAPLLPLEKEAIKPRRSIVVDEFQCTDMTLTIDTGKPGKAPLVFQIQSATLHDLGENHALPFDARLVNAKPVGDIHTTGSFGPWHGGDPRKTPVSGQYSFTGADLRTIKGISGTLESTGNYGGTLGEIAVTGTTQTPDFALDVSEHPVDLKTVFHATVDGTTGDTRLDSVHATLLHTVLQVSGTIRRVEQRPAGAGREGAEGAFPGDDPNHVPGHLIDIAVDSDQARIEDLLSLGVKTSPPLLRGAMTLRAHLQIPPGHVSISQKMRVQGTFAIHGATFSNPHWQQTVDGLSARASGDPHEAGTPQPQLARSDMDGRFELASATLNVPQLDYQVPGAQVKVTGTYSLDGNTFNFGGTVRTKATASQMLTGWKSILAMPFDRMLKKDGAGLEVPIKIDGTRSDPKIGVDMGKLTSEIFSRGKHKQARGTEPKP